MLASNASLTALVSDESVSAFVTEEAEISHRFPTRRWYASPAEASNFSLNRHSINGIKDSVIKCCLLENLNR
ncbi:hypothetical protein OGATHE_000062 [Ogataea polymorpha]|uniref:Uncharacterized protein n=1 Tax=Ogataea polymorpha TaxID=460523 RepID=A0A9P8PUS9_9ASCO|nr:hypothetical protein OGATHE_000062 [Ogataea polymorpha]